MDSQNDEETKGNNGSESEPSPEGRPESRLRDLRPEKDPMGAGGKTSSLEKTEASKPGDSDER